MISGMRFVRNYLDPTFVDPTKNDIAPFSHRWLALTSLNERISRIENKALRYIASFFALFAKLLSNLFYNSFILISNSCIRVRNYLARPKEKWNMTALKTWGVFIGMGLFHCLEKGYFFSSNNQTSLTITASSTTVLTTGLITGIASGLFLLTALFLRKSTKQNVQDTPTKETSTPLRKEQQPPEEIPLVYSLQNAKTQEECQGIIERNKLGHVTKQTSLDLPGLSDMSKEKIAPRMYELFGKDTLITLSRYQYPADMIIS